GTLMGFAVPQANEANNAESVRAFRRTPAAGTSSPGSEDNEGTHAPVTSAFGALPTQPLLVPGAAPQRAYQRSDNPARTLIGGTVPTPAADKAPAPPTIGPHATVPGFSPLPERDNAPEAGAQPKVSKETLIGVAMPQAVLDVLKAQGERSGPPPTQPAGSPDNSPPASEPASSRSADHLGRFRIQK